MNKRPLMAPVISLAILVLGCTAHSNLRAPDSFFTENPIKKVVVISSGRVEWPGLGKKEAVLGFAESKNALENITPALCRVFKRKGYDVAMCEPAGIAYYNPSYKENRVVEEGKEGREWQLKDREPAYLYPALQKDLQLSQALRNIHEKMEMDLSKKQLESFVPDKDDLQIVMKATGADTVCLSRVQGAKFSVGRKAAAAAVVVVAIAARAPNGVGWLPDQTTLSLVCASLTTGEVLWQYTYKKAPADPVDLGDTLSLIADALQDFPDRDKPLNAKYRKEKKKVDRQDTAKKVDQTKREEQ